MSDVRVSIVVPVYNGANYLREAIDSALAQTYSNIEIVVVNDGSTDGGATEEIVKSYGDKIVYIHKSNGKVASALNAGIRSMTGDVFCWLSHDDRFHPHKTARQVEEWTARGRKPEILIANYRLIDAQGATINDVVLNHDMLVEKPRYAVLRGCVHGCTAFVPRPVFESVGFFNEALRHTQDYDYWRRALAGFSFWHMPEVLIDSRLHDAQDSKREDRKDEVRDFWLTAVAEVSVADRVRLEGSETRFLQGAARFLKENAVDLPADELFRQADAVPSSKLVSVIVPTYNRPFLTFGAVSSVLRQTHQKFEIILVDDGSTEGIDDLNAIVENAGPRVRLFRQENQGPAAARNLGMAHVQGDYIAFLDSDDLFLPEKLQRQVRFMEETGAKFSHTSYFRHWKGRMELEYAPSGAGNAFPSIVGSCGIATPTVMLRRELIDAGVRFPTDFKLGEDVSLWIEIASEYGVVGLDEGLSIVRTGPDAAAYDRSKSLMGVSNILSFVTTRPHLAKHEDQVARLAALRSELARH